MSFASFTINIVRRYETLDDLNFRKLTKTELELFAPIFDKANQTLTYYDPNLKRTNTIQTYTGDWKVVNKHIINDKRKNEGFSISFIAKRKR